MTARSLYNEIGIGDPVRLTPEGCGGFVGEFLGLVRKGKVYARLRIGNEGE